MIQLVLLRHGQSVWNEGNRFSGWIDVDLTQRGVQEAHRAGKFLSEANFKFDIAYTSLLKRAIRTLWITLEELGLEWLPVQKDWRLNERHYGALQGLDKAEIADRFGKAKVFQWRRSFGVRPPALPMDDPMHPRHDPRYASIDPNDLPATESLQDTQARVMACWYESILPRLVKGERVLVVAHGNSLRALVKHLDGIEDTDVDQLNVPNGIPLVYDLDAHGNVLQRSYLGDPAVVQAAKIAADKAAQVRGKRET